MNASVRTPRCSGALAYHRVSSSRRISVAQSAAARLGGRRIAQRLVASIIEILIESPALDLRQRILEFLARQRAIIEPLAAAELGEIPGMVALEFSRDREPPQRQVFLHLRVHRLLRALEPAQPGPHDL